ncbi:type VI secretion system Vgr family protein [Cupriavidus nantongensis]|nr:type VI secretion system Vgr family protein [Cupriavidus nantongensis]
MGADADGHRNAAALTGFKSQEHGGKGYNQLVLDDSDSQLRTQLATTLQSTQLNLGHLVHQQDNRRGSFRGQGFELRTDGHAAVRGQAGLLLTTYRDAATGRALPTGDNAKRVMATQAQIAGVSALGPSQKSLKNPICKVLGDRITRAIYDGKPFHVYMVLPVHPEGTLDTINIMTQQHLTMQSLVLGSHSLVNRIRRALLAMRYVRERKMEVKRARELADEVKPNVLDEQVRQIEWEQYLTLLNLRNWDIINNRPVTEQIYVHSKLLIADDRVVILGSANINDRSQLGDRDSELAVIIHDDKPASSPLDGKHTQPVGTLAKDLRRALWRKHFGLMGGAAPAGKLDTPTILEAPANQDTWRAIKTLANANAEVYANAFPYLAKPRSRSSIWATWDSDEGMLKGYMPFNERFWRPDQPRDECFTWDAKQRLREQRPAGIRGFIVALPLQWMLGENNDSKMNLTTLANVDVDEDPDQTRQTAAVVFPKSDRANT